MSEGRSRNVDDDDVDFDFFGGGGVNLIEEKVKFYGGNRGKWGRVKKK